VEAWAPNFSWITPDLAVGGCFPVEQAAALATQHGVGAVIDARAEACDDAAALRSCGLRFLHLPTVDMTGVSQPMLDAGVRFARDAAADGLRTLVHCQHGIGRSAILALCILVDRGQAPLQALATAKETRALLSPSEAQFRAWVAWIERHGRGPAPSYHEFGVIAYRHLAGCN
jgi:predicted protein tyrosine phosphatase